MTAVTGIRRRAVPARPSAPTGQVQAQVAQAQMLPIVQGGTGRATAPEALTALGAPRLDVDNVWTGTNEFQNGIYVSAGTVDATAANADFADISGGYATLNTVDANGLRVGYVAKTADYTINTLTDCVVDVTANSPTITLPTAASIPGAVAIIKNSGAGTITMATTSSQTIDGAAPGTIAAGGVLRLFSDGANWQSW